MSKKFDQTASYQGWNENSINSILRSFISSIGKDKDLDAYAAKIAAEENGD